MRMKGVRRHLALVLVLLLGVGGIALARDPIAGRGVMETGTNWIGGVKFFLNGLWIGTNAQVYVNASTQLVSVVNGVTNLLGGASMSTNDVNGLWWANAATGTVANALSGWPTQWAWSSITNAGAVVTNGGNATLGTLNVGTITGNGSGLTNIPASSITGVTAVSGSASNLVPLMDWTATNNLTSAVVWAWPSRVTNIMIVASTVAFYSQPIPSDTLVCAPSPAALTTNLFRQRELISGTSYTTDYAGGLTALGLGNITGTNGYSVYGYRARVIARLSRTDNGFTFDSMAHNFGNGTTNTTYFDRRAGIWFGGATTNLTFSCLAGSTFASNSTIRIVEQ